MGCSTITKEPLDKETEEIFEHHFITNNLPDKPESRYGTFSITSDKVFWFEFVAADNWIRHDLAERVFQRKGGL